MYPTCDTELKLVGRVLTAGVQTGRLSGTQFLITCGLEEKSLDRGRRRVSIIPLLSKIKSSFGMTAPHPLAGDVANDTDRNQANNAAAVAVDLPPKQDIDLSVNENAVKQQELVRLQTQMTGIQSNFDLVAQSCSDALESRQGDCKRRNINAVLTLIAESQESMTKISESITQLLAVGQLDAQFQKLYEYSLKLQELRKTGLTRKVTTVKEPPATTRKSVKLSSAPKIPLFMGDAPSWPSFIRQFDSLVGTNDKFSDRQKVSLSEEQCTWQCALCSRPGIIRSC